MNGAGGADDRSVREDESAGIASLLRQRRSTKSYRQKSVDAADLEAANGHFAEQGPRRGEGFSWLETGLIAQTVQLYVAEKGLGTVVLGGLVGADASVHSWLPDSHTILALMPLGHPA